MAKSAAERFKERRAKMTYYNKNVVNPNYPVNQLTSEEFKQQSRNRDKKYNRMMGGALSAGRPIGAATLFTMKHGGKGVDNIKRIFAPSDSEILQKRLKKNYKNFLKRKK